MKNALWIKSQLKSNFCWVCRGHYLNIEEQLRVGSEATPALFPYNVWKATPLPYLLTQRKLTFCGFQCDKGKKKSKFNGPRSTNATAFGDRDDIHRKAKLLSQSLEE
jgi:hypothetical protein